MKTEYIFAPSCDNGRFEYPKKSSNDPIRQVGAVLITKDGGYYHGFNFIRDLHSLRPSTINPISDFVWKKNRPLGRLLADHAEKSAILEAVLDGQVDFSEAVLYVSLEPCSVCRQIIEAAGIKKVVFAEYYVPST